MTSKTKSRRQSKPRSLAEAILQEFPSSHPHYHEMILRRYLVREVPEREAIKAVCAGYSSPTAAMFDGLIKWRDPVAEL